MHEPDEAHQTHESKVTHDPHDVICSQTVSTEREAAPHLITMRAASKQNKAALMVQSREMIF